MYERFMHTTLTLNVTFYIATEIFRKLKSHLFINLLALRLASLYLSSHIRYIVIVNVNVF